MTTLPTSSAAPMLTAMAATISACLLLSGCGMTPTARDTNVAASRMTAEVDQLLQIGSASRQDGSKAEPTKVLDYWIGAEPVADLPLRHNALDARHIVMKESFASLAEVADWFTRNTGIHTRIARETIPSANEAATFDFVGPLSKGLDAVAARYGVYWRESPDGGVVLALTDTRVFYLSAVGGDIANQVSVSGASGATGGASGAATTSGDQRTTLTAQLSSFRAIEDTVRVMLSPSGRVVSTPAGGTITVTDVPDVLERVAHYIDQQDAYLSRQIAFDVRVFTLSLTRSDDYGFDWNALGRSLSGNFGVRLQASSGAGSGTSSFALFVPSTGSSTLAGSELVARALSDQGKVLQKTSATLRTSNNKPVQYQRGNVFSYVPRSGTTTTANVGSTFTVETVREQVGFSLNVLPNADALGNVMMQVTLRLTALRNLRRIQQGSGANQTTVESPEIDITESIQQTRVPKGGTLVLAGFEQMSDSLNQSGVGSPSNTLLGGERGRNARDVLVVTITPVVAEKS